MIEIVGMSALVAATVVFGALPSRPLDHCDPLSTRAQSTRRAELRGTIVLAVGGVTAAVALNALVAGSPVTALTVVALGIVALLAMHPGPAVRTILVPLGAWRAAAAASRWGGPPWLRDPEGGAVLMGVVAATRAGGDPLYALETLEAELLRAPLRGAGMVATGLIAAARGDVVFARRILTSVDELDPDVCPPLARAIANDWLMEDAASRERWSEVDARGEHGTLSGPGRLLHTTARRLLGRATRFEVLRAWVSSRQWTSMSAWSSMLALTWGEADIDYPIVDIDLSARAANGLGPLGSTAPSLHLDAVKARRSGELHPAVLQRLGLAWDEALWDLDARRRVRARSMQLDCRETVEHTVVGLHRDLCTEVAALLPPNGPIPRNGRTLERAVRLFAGAQQHRMEQAVVALHSATTAVVSPTHTQIWALWLDVRDGYDLYARAVREPPQQLERFTEVEARMAPVVHWLWHHRAERPLANAIATWLALEAERLRDSESARYHRQYVAAGP